MAASLEDLTAKFTEMTKQFDEFTEMSQKIIGLQDLMKQALDSVHDTSARVRRMPILCLRICASKRSRRR